MALINNQYLFPEFQLSPTTQALLLGQICALSLSISHLPEHYMVLGKKTPAEPTHFPPEMSWLPEEGTVVPFTYVNRFTSLVAQTCLHLSWTQGGTLVT